MPPPRALLLDLDDTILDDNAGVESSWQTVCEGAAARLGLPDAAALVTSIRAYADEYWRDPGRHREGRLDLRAARRVIVAQALRAHGRNDPAEVARVGEEYSALREAAYCPLPGAIETLAELRAMGLRMALLTNGAAVAQRSKVDRFELARYFDGIFIEGEFGCGKPDPRVYGAALALLEARPDEAWMVGDNFEWEVVAPKELGLGAVWVDAAGAGPPPGSAVRPDHTVRSVCELPELLRAAGYA